jgi:hypothetical protein
MIDTLAGLVISEVKCRRSLWDTKHNIYHNRMFVDREWFKVVENVGETSKYFFKFYYLITFGYSQTSRKSMLQLGYKYSTVIS